LLIAPAVAALLTIPLWGSPYFMLLVITFFLYAAMAQMWNLLAGYSGLISLGQQCFIGLGGYTLAVLAEQYGFPVWAAVLVGGTVAALFALVISIPLFRTTGVYFAVGSWITAEALKIAFTNWDYVHAGTGIFIRSAYRISLGEVYYAALAAGAGSVALVYAILRSDLGLGLAALSEDEIAAQSVGVDASRSKLACFLISAFVTGIAAGVLYLQQIFIQPYNAFSIDWTVRLLFIVIIGGIGTVEGPIVGACFFVLLQRVFSDYDHFSMLLMGATAIIVMLAAPRGIVGELRARWGFEIVSTRRR